MRYDMALKEKYAEEGLVRDEIMELYDCLNGEEVYPVEIYAKDVESVAMGFITAEAAEKIDFLPNIELNNFIDNILSDINNENPDGEYEFKGLKIKLTR